jgi:hypothetical protein
LDQGRLIGNTTMCYTDRTVWRQTTVLPGLIPNAASPSYWLVNALLGIRKSNDKYELAVYAMNPFNAASNKENSPAARSRHLSTLFESDLNYEADWQCQELP